MSTKKPAPLKPTGLCAELLKVAALDFDPDVSYNVFCHNLLVKLATVDENAFSAISDAGQKWFNEAGDAVNKAEEEKIPLGDATIPKLNGYPLFEQAALPLTAEEQEQVQGEADNEAAAQGQEEGAPQPADNPKENEVSTKKTPAKAAKTAPKPAAKETKAKAPAAAKPATKPAKAATKPAIKKDAKPAAEKKETKPREPGGNKDSLSYAIREHMVQNGPDTTWEDVVKTLGLKGHATERGSHPFLIFGHAKTVLQIAVAHKAYRVPAAK